MHVDVGGVPYFGLLLLSSGIDLTAQGMKRCVRDEMYKVGAVRRCAVRVCGEVYAEI